MQERFYESGNCVQKNCAILGVHPKELGPTWVQNSGQLAPFSSLSSGKATESTRFMERAMGIEPIANRCTVIETNQKTRVTVGRNLGAQLGSTRGEIAGCGEKGTDSREFPKSKNGRTSLQGRCPVTALIRWDEFCMSPLASQRSMKTGSGLTMLCQDVWSRGLRPYWCFRARG